MFQKHEKLARVCPLNILTTEMLHVSASCALLLLSDSKAEASIVDYIQILSNHKILNVLLMNPRFDQQKSIYIYVELTTTDHILNDTLKTTLLHACFFYLNCMDAEHVSVKLTFL